MVEEVRGWKTKYGSVHETEEQARKAEREEALSAFSEDIRTRLGMSCCAWQDNFGDEWARSIFNNPMLFHELFNKYKLV